MIILIVDDNPDMRKLIRSSITVSTDTVDECVDGSKVMDAYANLHPDFVLMDINMPVMNGIEATRNLKKQYPEARVIIVTSYSEIELREDAKEAGAENYFQKENLMELKNYLTQQLKH